VCTFSSLLILRVIFVSGFIMIDNHRARHCCRVLQAVAQFLIDSPSPRRFFFCERSLLLMRWGIFADY
jgi:hypothetical protein